MKLKQSIQIKPGTVIPKGTELHFSKEGVGYFKGLEIRRNRIPKAAIESEGANEEPVALPKELCMETLSVLSDKPFAENVLLSEEELDVIKDAMEGELPEEMTNGVAIETVELLKPAMEEGDEVEVVDGNLLKNGEVVLEEVDDKTFADVCSACGIDLDEVKK